MAAEIADDLATPGRVTDVNRILQIQRFRERRRIIRVSVRLIAGPRLGGGPVPSPVMRNDAIAMLPKEQHLRVPVVRGQRPTVREDDRLARSPILVVDLRAVFGSNCGHVFFSFVTDGGCQILCPTAPVNADGSATAATVAVPTMRRSRRVTKLFLIEFSRVIYFFPRMPFHLPR